MWKYFRQSIRNTTNRNSLHKRPLRKRYNIQVDSATPENKCLTPSVVNFEKTSFGSKKEEKTRDSNESRWKNAWQEAICWSGLIAMGLTVSQSLRFKKSLDEICNKSMERISVDFHFSNIITEFKNVKPKKMLNISQCDDNLVHNNENKNANNTFGSISHEEFNMLIHRHNQIN